MSDPAIASTLRLILDELRGIREAVQRDTSAQVRNALEGDRQPKPNVSGKLPPPTWPARLKEVTDEIVRTPNPVSDITRKMVQYDMQRVAEHLRLPILIGGRDEADERT